jgi:hypothetical protein
LHSSRSADYAVRWLRRNDARSTLRTWRTAHQRETCTALRATRTDIRSESLNIDGHSGWLIDSEISVDRPDLQVAGDHTIFIVVRDGKDWGFFFGAVPIGNAQLDAVLARTIRGLRCESDASAS